MRFWRDGLRETVSLIHGVEVQYVPVTQYDPVGEKQLLEGFLPSVWTWVKHTHPDSC